MAKHKDTSSSITNQALKTADIHQHVWPYYVHQDNPPTLLSEAMKPSTRQGCAEILGDPYSKKSPLPGIWRLAGSPKTTSYGVLGQPWIIQRQVTRSNHPRIIIPENIYWLYLLLSLLTIWLAIPIDSQFVHRMIDQICWACAIFCRIM